MNSQWNYKDSDLKSEIEINDEPFEYCANDLNITSEIDVKDESFVSCGVEKSNKVDIREELFESFDEFLHQKYDAEYDLVRHQIKEMFLKTKEDFSKVQGTNSQILESSSSNSFCKKRKEANKTRSKNNKSGKSSNSKKFKKSIPLASILYNTDWEDQEEESLVDPETKFRPIPKRNEHSQIEEVDFLNQNLVCSAQVEIEDNSESEDDDVPLATLFPENEDLEKEDSSNIHWSKSKFQPKDISWKDKLTWDDSWNTFTPLDFFLLLFDEKLMKHIVEQTNNYALQSKRAKLGLDLEELKSYFGISMKFGLSKAPCYRYFWKNLSKFHPIADSMTYDRFEEIKSFLQFNNNAFMKPSNHPEYDKLYKIRPVIDAIRNNCRKIPQEEHQMIGEQIIPIKAHSALKNYNPNKPHKSDYKIVSRCGESGFIYDFLIYKGTDFIKDSGNVGIASASVINLSEGLPRNKNYKLFFDDSFSSIPLVKVLTDRSVLCLSTVRPNRLERIKLKEEKDLKIEGLGSYDFCVEQNSQIILIKWYFNKTVLILSNYAGIEPVDMYRWNGKLNKTVDIPRPLAVKEYNKFVRGGNLSDTLMELYRIDFKLSKWYIHIFFFILDMIVANAWLLHLRVQSVQSGKRLSLPEFKDDVASGLMTRARDKRDCPVEQGEINKIKKAPCSPADTVHQDEILHLPKWISHPRRCENCVIGESEVICSKCNVALCFTRDRNCYVAYHKIM